MLVCLHVVVDTEDKDMEEEVQNRLLELCPDFSFSPSRPQPSLVNCMEFYATGQMEAQMAENLRTSLNNDWEGETDDCDAYGFNTCMFHPHVYYLQWQVRK